VRAAQPGAALYVYEGAGHGFNREQREGDAPAAALARTRTLEFLARNIAGVQPARN
jgi:carboxymethylenebutenolidase